MTGVGGLNLWGALVVSSSLLALSWISLVKLIFNQCIHYSDIINCYSLLMNESVCRQDKETKSSLKGCDGRFISACSLLFSKTQLICIGTAK